MLTEQTSYDDCVGNEYSDIEAELMRQGGKLPELLIFKRKGVIQLQEVDIHQLTIAREWATQCWVLETAEHI